MKKILLSIFISSLIILTKNFYPVILTGNNDIGFSIIDLILFILITILLYFCIGKYNVLKFFKKDIKVSIKYKHICLIVLIILLIGFFVNYTSVMKVTTDIIWNNILSGNGSNHHPVINRIFLEPGIIAYNLTENLNIGILINRIVLLIFNFVVYSILNCYIWKKTHNFKYLVFSLIWTMLLPINFYFQTVVWKDTYFVGFSILFLVGFYEIIDSNFKILKNKIFDIVFVFVSLMMLLIRSNAFAAFLFLFVFLLLKYKRLIKKGIILIFIIIICLFLLITKVIFPMKYDMNVSSAETSAIKLSYLSSLVVDNKIEEEDKGFLNTIIQKDYVNEIYNVNCIDSIKFNSHFSDEYFNKNLDKFNDIANKYIIKYPLLFLKSYLISTYQLWSLYCPDFTAGLLWLNISQIPIISLLACPITYVLLYRYLIFKYRKDNLLWLITIFPIGVYITLIFTMPVNISIRYVYILFPILSLVLIPLIKNTKKCSK